MATVKRTIAIKIEMSSGASEADMETHIECYMRELKAEITKVGNSCWHDTVHTDWDTSYPVTIRSVTYSNVIGFKQNT